MFLLFGGFSQLFTVFGSPEFPVEDAGCSGAIHSNIFYFIFDFSGTRLIVFLGWGVVVLSLRCVYIMFLVIFR